MNLADMRGLVRRDLMDTVVGSYRWSDDDIDRAVQRAVAEFSKHLPHPQKDTVATTEGSRDIDISALADRVSVDKVEFPVEQSPKVYQTFAVYMDTLTMTGDREGNGEDCYIYWGKMHTLNADTSTIPAKYESLIALAAAAYALESYADSTLSQKVQTALEAAKTALDEVSGKVSDAETALSAAAGVDSDIATQLTSAADVGTEIATQISSAVAELTLAGNAVDDAIRTGTGSIDQATGTEITNAKDRITAAITDLSNGNTALGNAATPMSAASAAIGNMTARISQAVNNLATGDDYINTVNVGGDVARTWAEYAGREVDNALGYNRQAEGYLGLAQDYIRQADGYFTESGRNLEGAAQYIAVAQKYYQKRNAYLDAGARYTQEAQAFLTVASELNKKRLAYLQAASELNRKRLGYLQAAQQYIASTFPFIQEASQHQRDARQYQDNAKLLSAQAKSKIAKFLQELKSISITRRIKQSTITTE